MSDVAVQAVYGLYICGLLFLDMSDLYKVCHSNFVYGDLCKYRKKIGGFGFGRGVSVFDTSV